MTDNVFFNMANNYLRFIYWMINNDLRFLYFYLKKNLIEELVLSEKLGGDYSLIYVYAFSIISH